VRRRAAATTTLGGRFARLGLTPRRSVELIGEATIVFVDGLVLDHAVGGNTRASFDVFWLAILGPWRLMAISQAASFAYRANGD